MEEKIPTVFISYSHDSKEHQDRVLKLSNKLRAEGIKPMFDKLGFEFKHKAGQQRYVMTLAV